MSQPEQRQGIQEKYDQNTDTTSAKRQLEAVVFTQGHDRDRLKQEIARSAKRLNAAAIHEKLESDGDAEMWHHFEKPRCRTSIQTHDDSRCSRLVPFAFAFALAA